MEVKKGRRQKGEEEEEGKSEREPSSL